jgi:quinol monooxygenase YgiN
VINVVELRQYTLHPGQRDVLIELFDREFLETQEAVGMRVFGQFRDAADPDRFVWVRGFDNMESRLQALTAFYKGPAWKANSAAANATMIDSDNVLLLRPKGSGFEVPDASERPSQASPVPTSVIVAVLARPGEVAPAGGDELGV